MNLIKHENSNLQPGFISKNNLAKMIEKKNHIATSWMENYVQKGK